MFQTAKGKRHDRKDILRSIYTAGDVAGLNPFVVTSCITHHRDAVSVTVSAVSRKQRRQRGGPCGHL